MMQGDQLGGATAVIQARDDGGSEQGGCNGGSKLVDEFWENLKGGTTVFPDWYREKGVMDD